MSPLRRSNRFALLLLAFALPYATPVLAETILSFGLETETACEDIEECLSVSKCNRFRRRGQQTQSVIIDRSVDHSSHVGQRRTDLFYASHRISIGLLVPMRC